MGSPAVAALVAQLAFWFLLVYGRFWGELTAAVVLLFVALWTVGLFALPSIPYGAGLVSSYVAVLDIILVFLIFKGDVRLT